MDVLADPAKMITLLALRTFSVKAEEGSEDLIAACQEKVTISDLAARCNELQGPYLTRITIKDGLAKQCKSLLSAKLVEMETVIQDGRLHRIVNFTEKGITDGVMVSGGQLGLQLETPHEGFLETVMGTRADTRRANPRVNIYGKLLKGPATIMEITRHAKISHARVSHFVNNLSESGVLSYEDLRDRKARTYLLAEGDFPITTKVRPISQVILEAATSLRASGKKTVNAQDLLHEVGRLKPLIPTEEVWQSLLTWLAYKPHRNGLIRPVDEPTLDRSKISISPDFHPDIAQMLEMRRLLASKDSDDTEAKKFQANAYQDAHDIIRSPKLVAQILAYRSTSENDAA
jgi:hypothetical protein